MSSSISLSNLKILSGNHQNYESIFKKIDLIVSEVELQSGSANKSQDPEIKNDSLHLDMPPAVSPMGETPPLLLSFPLPTNMISAEVATTQRPKFGLKSYQYRNLDEMASFLPLPTKPINMNNSSCCEITSQCISESTLSTSEPATSSRSNGGTGIRMDDQEARLQDIKSWRRNLFKMSNLHHKR